MSLQAGLSNYCEMTDQNITVGESSTLTIDVKSLIGNAYIESLLATKEGAEHDNVRFRRQTAVDVLRGVKRQLELVIRDGTVAAHNVTSIDKPNKTRGIF